MPSPSTTIPDIRAGLRTALDLAVATVDSIDTDQFHAPTPCTEYDVTELVAHLIGAIRRVSDIAQDLPNVDELDEHLDLASPLAPQVRRAGDAAVLAWDEVDLTSERSVPWATLSAELMLEMYVMEFVTHTWDLAIATGQPRDWDAAFGTLVLEAAANHVPDELPRGGEMPFESIRPVAEDADPYTKLAAFLGRAV